METGLKNKSAAMPINALYCCCIAIPWINVAKELDKTFQVKPKYFIGWKDNTKSKRKVSLVVSKGRWYNN